MLRSALQHRTLPIKPIKLFLKNSIMMSRTFNKVVILQYRSRAVICVYIYICI
jgi:hypothetical protein